MFSEHAIRMIRERWRSAIPLSEELFALFSSAELPLSHNGPVTLTSNNNEAPLTLRTFGDGPALSFDFGDGNVSNLSFGPNGPEFSDADGQPQEEEPAGRIFPGEVVGGSGPEYSVLVFKGEDETPTVTATHLGLESNIPAGTRAWALETPSGAWEFIHQRPMQFFPAVIQSGSGQTYQVTVFPNGRAGSGSFTVSATQPQMVSGATIPANTPCWALNTAGGWEILGIPVWLQVT